STNVDTGAGAAFLNRVVQARRDYSRAGRGEPGPLLIVATSQRCLPNPAAALPNPEGASYSDWMRRIFRSRDEQRGDDARWYPVGLRGLCVDEIGRLVELEGIPEPRRVAVLLHRLTKGHPAAVALLASRLAVGLLGKSGRRGRDAAVELRRLLMPPPKPANGGLAPEPIPPVLRALPPP